MKLTRGATYGTIKQPLIRSEVFALLGTHVHVTVDRPMGSTHPQHPDLYYPVNYGYIEGIKAPDGDWQDAYILGVTVPVEHFDGSVIAIIHRFDDVEEKWVVAPNGMHFTRDDIYRFVQFQEQYFHVEIRI